MKLKYLKEIVTPCQVWHKILKSVHALKFRTPELFRKMRKSCPPARRPDGSPARVHRPADARCACLCHPALGLPLDSSAAARRAPEIFCSEIPLRFLQIFKSD